MKSIIKKDILAPDGIVYCGDRLIRAKGKLKYAGNWWQDDRLLPFVGHYLGVRTEGYWMTEITIWNPSYPNGIFLFTIKL